LALVINLSDVTAASSTNSSLSSQKSVTIKTAAKTSSNIKFTPSQINNAATKVKNYYNSNQKLPNYVTIANKKISMPQFLYLMSVQTLQIKNGTNYSIVLKNVTCPKNASETVTYGKINKTELLQIAQTIKTNISSKGAAPNYVNSSLGNIRFETLTVMYSKLLDFYTTKNRLPNYITVQPWTTAATTGTKTKAQLLAAFEAIGKAEAKFLDIQGQSYPDVMERVGYGDCWADSLWLYDHFLKAGIGARILGSGWHRWVEYNLGEGWKEFPGYLNNGRKWGGHHYGSGGYSGRTIYVCSPTPTPHATKLHNPL
jgi:hypothetical protein